MAHAHCMLDTQGYKHEIRTCKNHCFYRINNGCTNAPECCVIRTVPVLYFTVCTERRSINHLKTKLRVKNSEPQCPALCGAHDQILTKLIKTELWHRSQKWEGQDHFHCEYCLMKVLCYPMLPDVRKKVLRLSPFVLPIKATCR